MMQSAALQHKTSLIPQMLALSASKTLAINYRRVCLFSGTVHSFKPNSALFTCMELHYDQQDWKQNASQ